jgi:hypothetical protein
MSFTDEEKVRIRHHLGYLGVQQTAAFVLGAPAGVETQFLIETAMNKVIPEAESLARNLIARCDLVETQVIENQELLAVTAVGEISVRQDEFSALMQRYQYHRQALANMLGIYPNPFDKRFASGGLNATVQH